MCLDHAAVAMNITLKIERPVSSFFWNSLRGVSRSPVTVVKDDPYTNFAIKQKAETIHQLLGLSIHYSENWASLKIHRNFSIKTKNKLQG